MPLLQQQQRHVNHLSDEDKAWLRSKRELQFEWEHQQQFEKYWKLNNHEGREEETEETQRFGAGNGTTSTTSTTSSTIWILHGFTANMVASWIRTRL
ncbi:GH12219 [Drosophila grimshawi]|uniref:GH12219 n=1 Tax=Drosophila grimshawi TaxID=7222 RepID=B4JJM8_DROGR|nr:GH12219 [Drosophila grimshawi]